MNKTIYLKDDDGPIWDKARELSGDKLSPIVLDGLKKFIAERESKAKDLGRIVVQYIDSQASHRPRAQAFYGRWVIPPEKPIELFDDNNQINSSYAVALTAKGGIVVHGWSEDDESGRYGYWLETYKDFDAAIADKKSNFAACRALEVVGVPVEELDI